MKKIMLILGFILGTFSFNAVAEPLCEMPPGIDDEKYWIKFKSESKMYVYEIIDIDDCWVQIKKSDGSKYWFQIQDIETIMGKAVE
jgi:hypothetical protein